jgi:hypothetical protein
LYVTNDRFFVSKEDFASQICDAAEATGDASLKPKDGNWDDFKAFLCKILSLEKTLGISSKAQEIMLEHGHIFCRARIVTDLRPVFGSRVEGGPIAGIIVHSLKLTYHESGNPDTKDTYLALDHKDMEKLRELLVRASRKEKSLKATAKKGGVNVLEV